MRAVPRREEGVVVSPVPILCSIVWLAPMAGQPKPKEPVPPQQAIESHIRDLGSKDDAVRKDAAKALLRIGGPARAALEEAARSDDPQVRSLARDVLADIRVGIRPNWPADIIPLVRNYDELGEHERPNALRRIADALKEKAVPFLVRRLQSGSTDEARDAYYRLRRIKGEAACRQVIALLKEAATPYQSMALAWARACTGSTRGALEILARGDADASTRNEMVEAGVAGLIKQLKSREFEEVAKLAPKFAKAAADDSRFLYLGAEALVALERDLDAEALRRRALALNPDKEAPHYTAGEMLGELGRRSLAAREWEAILSIPPADEVYDINAHLRLGSIYAACRQFERAANSFEKACEIFLEARQAGQGMGVLGGSLEDLRKKVARLRRKAARYPEPADATIEDVLGDTNLHVNITVTVKDDKLEELRRALGKVEATLSMNVQPYGLRIFDLAPTTLRYEPGKQQIVMLLNNSPCARPVPLKPRGAKAQVAVNTLDCFYIFDIDTATGKAKKIARFEKDYVLKFHPGIKIAAYTDMVVKINDKKYDWEKLLKGADLDYLPETFDVLLQGTTPSGRRATMRFKVRPKEPEIKPIRPTRPK